MLSNKSMSSENKNLTEGTKISKKKKKKKNEKESGKVLNNLFSTFIQNLKIPQHKDQDPISASNSNPVMRAIFKYRVHPSIIAIKKNCNASTLFKF